MWNNKEMVNKGQLPSIKGDQHSTTRMPEQWAGKEGPRHMKEEESDSGANDQTIW